jgi:hypothetical protein
MTVSFKGAHFPPEIILTGVRWYVAYPLSTRHVEELMWPAQDNETSCHVRVSADYATFPLWLASCAANAAGVMPLRAP